MVSVLKPYLEDIPAWLVLLKYAGLALAAGASIWATLNVLTTTTADGRKRLTTAGIVSIGFTISGLMISVVSEDLQRRNSAETQKRQIAKEARRTNNIILAGQRVTSLQFDWEIKGLDADLLTRVKQAGEKALEYIKDETQGERSSDQNDVVYRYYQLYPFLVDLAHTSTKKTDEPPNSNIVSLMNLDDDYSAVLAFGYVKENDIWPPSSPSKSKSRSLSEGIEVGISEASSDYGSNPNILHWPALQSNDDTLRISWRLDPSTLAKSINLHDEHILLTAKQPKLLRIAILFDINKVPFEPENFALPQDQDFWEPSNCQQAVDPPPTCGLIQPAAKFSSSIEIIPNNSSEVVYRYKFARMYETIFLDAFGEQTTGARCLIFEFSRVDD